MPKQHLPILKICSCPCQAGPNRLLVSYRADAPAPEHWLRFLSELLEPEDIPALQEYLGYCLIPSTKGQKMLMLIGKGGEGKSRIGVVMNAIFGLNTVSYTHLPVL